MASFEKNSLINGICESTQARVIVGEDGAGFMSGEAEGEASGLGCGAMRYGEKRFSAVGRLWTRRPREELSWCVEGSVSSKQGGASAGRSIFMPVLLR